MDNLDLSLVVVSDVDGCLLDGDTYSPGAAVEALGVLRDRGVPLVLCSSKTSSELQALQERLGLDHPFICENGAAIYVPSGYFPFDLPGSVRKRGCEVLVFGGGHEAVVGALRRAARAVHVDLQLFADMTVADVARESGLSAAEAVLAKQREYDEPFRLRAVGPCTRDGLEHLLAAEDIRIVRGGRYDHAVMHADKGTAMLALRRLYRKAHGPVTTVGLGDALNDVPLLRSVDVPVVVRSASDVLTRDVLRLVPWAQVTDAVGPAGWHAAVLDAVNERVRVWQGPHAAEA